MSLLLRPPLHQNSILLNDEFTAPQTIFVACYRDRLRLVHVGLQRAEIEIFQLDSQVSYLETFVRPLHLETLAAVKQE